MAEALLLPLHLVHLPSQLTVRLFLLPFAKLPLLIIVLFRHVFTQKLLSPTDLLQLFLHALATRQLLCQLAPFTLLLLFARAPLILIFPFKLEVPFSLA